MTLERRTTSKAGRINLHHHGLVQGVGCPAEAAEVHQSPPLFPESPVFLHVQVYQGPALPCLCQDLPVLRKEVCLLINQVPQDQGPEQCQRAEVEAGLALAIPWQRME